MPETSKHKELPLEEVKNEALQLYREYHFAVSVEEPDESSKEQVQRLAAADFEKWQKNTKHQLNELKKLMPDQDPFLHLYALEYLLGHFDEIHKKAAGTWKNRKKAVEPVRNNIRREVDKTLHQDPGLN